MRIAKCIRPLQVNLLGNRSSVAIGEGWQGDLDQVIGESTDRGPMTIADALGPHLNDSNFEIAAPAKSSAKASPAATPQTE